MKDDDGKSKQFGFVCYKNTADATRALEELNDKDGLFVTRAMKKDERKKEVRKQTEKFKKSMVRFNLFLKNVPDSATDEELFEFFSKFGEVKNLRIVRNPH
jgi:polyadenylate-binding protein